MGWLDYASLAGRGMPQNVLRMQFGDRTQWDLFWLSSRDLYIADFTSIAIGNPWNTCRASLIIEENQPLYILTPSHVTTGKVTAMISAAGTAPTTFLKMLYIFYFFTPFYDHRSFKVLYLPTLNPFFPKTAWPSFAQFAQKNHPSSPNRIPATVFFSH